MWRHRAASGRHSCGVVTSPSSVRILVDIAGAQYLQILRIYRRRTINANITWRVISIKLYLEIFFSFFRIGALTFGGGYSMLPMIKREIAEKRKWATSEEILDYFAVAQCLPGLIAVNTAIFIGYNVRKKSGAAVAAAGLITPSVIIILLIASILQNFADLAIVQSAFAGIRVAVCALVIQAIYTMAKKGIVDVPTAVIGILTFVAATFFGMQPVPLVLAAAAAGLGLSYLGVGKISLKPKTGGEK